MDRISGKYNWRTWVEHPFVRALALSLIFHLLLLTGFEFAARTGLINRALAPSRLLRADQSQIQKIFEQQQKQQQSEPPLMFVQVDPAKAEPEPPKETPYYSSHNTTAANPERKFEALQPQISGAQKLVPKTEDVAITKPEPAKPEVTKPVEAAKPIPKEVVESKPAPPKGDLVMREPSAELKPSANPGKAQEEKKEQPRSRPRTLAQARQEKGLIQGEKMKQEGGVKRLAIEHNLDARATPFGAYDSAFIAAVSSRWFGLLSERDFVRNMSGKVVLEFRLTMDGRITDMHVAQNTVSETLAYICQRAVLDPAPFAHFPRELRLLLGKDYREVRFTFHYN